MERFHYCFATDFLEFPAFEFAHPGLDAAAGSFARNLLRIQSLGRLPVLLVGAATMLQTYEMLARFKLGINGGDPAFLLGHPEFDKDRFAAKESLRKEMQMEWFKRAQAGEEANGMTVGEVALGNMIPAGGDETAEGIEAILMGMITGVWTSFEVLAEDVWNRAVLERPSLEAQITDKEWKSSGFRSTKKLRHLYGYIFRTDETEIFNVLNDDRIDALSLTRNIIVHTGGVIDGDFDGRRATIQALDCFAATPVNQKISLTGPIVLHLLKPMTLLGLQLVKSVDSWLSSHP